MIVVTGGVGFIGAHVVRAIAATGRPVAVLDNLTVGDESRVATVESYGALFHHVDIRDPDATGEALEQLGPEAVVHLAAHHFIPFCVTHPAETIRTNVEGLQNVLDVLPKSTRRLLFASTADVYGPSDTPHAESDPLAPINVYGASKMFGERLIAFWPRRTEVSVLSMRFFNAYGPGETNPHVLPDICDAMKVGDQLPLGNVTTTRDYIYVEDIADAVTRLIDTDHQGEVNVASGLAQTVADLVEQLRTITGRPLEIQQDPSKIRPVERQHLGADTSLLNGWLPDRKKTDIRTGLTELLASEGLL